MFKKLSCGLALVLLGALVTVAQTPARGGAGRRGAAGRRGGNPFQRGPRIQSPQVNPDGSITVRLYAPDAHTVVATGELDGKQHPMTKAANGVWSVTIGPLAPNVYNYQFVVDGVATTDPNDPAIKQGFGAFDSASLVEVPAQGGLTFDDAQDNPHGDVHMVTYHSKALGVERTMWVYTPPGYSQSTQRYPVFYLLHGTSGTDSSWVLTGRENYIMDNLIDSGAARPMIVVNPNAYPSEGIGIDPMRPQDWTALGIGGAPAGGRAARGRGRGGFNAAGPSPFERDLLGDIIPFIQSHFRTLNDPDDRALGGLSMGGFITMNIGFRHTDLFHSLVIMSAGSNNADQAYPAFFKDPTVTNNTLKLLWVGVGTADTLVGPGAYALNSTLTAKGIHHVWWTLPGARHEWVTWRHALDVVGPMLFKPSGSASR